MEVFITAPSPLIYFMFTFSLLMFLSNRLLLILEKRAIIYQEWKYNRLYLTNFRLIKEREIIGKRYMAIGLDKIQDITCSYGILGKIFDFGDLIIESAGTEGKIVLEAILSLKKLRWMIKREASKSGL